MSDDEDVMADYLYLYTREFHGHRKIVAQRSETILLKGIITANFSGIEQYYLNRQNEDDRAHRSLPHSRFCWSRKQSR